MNSGLATGCSGAEAPHFALQQLVGHEGFEQLWGSEINEKSTSIYPKELILSSIWREVSCIAHAISLCLMTFWGANMLRFMPALVRRCVLHHGRLGPCGPWTLNHDVRFDGPFFMAGQVVAVVLVMVVIVPSLRAKLIFLLEDSHVLRRCTAKSDGIGACRGRHVSHWQCL